MAVAQSVPLVGALPYGIVGCGTGKESVVTNFNIGNHTQLGGGPIADNNVTITIDNEVLDPNIPFDFEALKDHKLTLSAQGDQFSEFLVRLDGSFTVDAILPIETIDPLANATCLGDAKKVFICKQAYFVAGVSHYSPEKKSMVDLKLNMDSVTSHLILDVSVGTETRVSSRISQSGILVLSY